MKYKITVGKDWFVNTSCGFLGLFLLYLAIKETDYILGIFAWLISVINVETDLKK